MIPQLVVITDWALGEARLFAQLEAALGAGAIAVQHRNPSVTTRVYFEQAQRLKALCDRFSAPLFVSARLEVAIALDAHLHLPRWAIAAGDVPRRAGKWLSASVHDEAEAARAGSADLALVSPVFSKGAIGVEGFGRIAQLLPCPAYALGGVDGSRAVTGAAGAAVISAVLHAADPGAAVRGLLGWIAVGGSAQGIEEREPKGPRG